VPRVESAGTTVRAVCAVLLLGALGRILSLVETGPPHPFYLVLLVIELVLPLVLVPWQTSVARRTVPRE
jgi:hypothetical protein